VESLKAQQQSSSEKIESSLELKTPEEKSRRRHPRYSFMRRAEWDFFTSGTGGKAGYFENISESGCLLRTTEPIEHRRWIRLVVKEPKTNFYFTAVGRIMRREDRMESWHGDADEREPGDSPELERNWAVTLHRYGVEFIHPLNAVALDRIQQGRSRCSQCGTSPASIADLLRPDAYFCVLCHLRRACQNLLSTDQPDSSRQRVG
jgi:hypothetical protein